MKRLVAFIFSLSLLTAFLLTSVHLVIFDKSFFENQFALNQTAQALDVSTEDLNQANTILLDYIQDKRSDMNFEIIQNASSESFFNDKEKAHMVDVKMLYQNSVLVRNLSFIFALLSGLILVFILKVKEMTVFRKGYYDALVIIGSLITALAFYAMIDFQAFWISFHKVVFSNQLWLLNPATDRLIVMVPLNFFNGMVINIFLSILASYSLLFIMMHIDRLKNYRFKMNARFLKNSALIIMVIDHVGHFLLPEFIVLRVIGRLAFPIFTFLFAQSARYTSNRKSLAIRLSIGAVAGQALMFFFGATEIISIFFLFILALALFEMMDRNLEWSVFLIAISAEIFGVDYGAYGIFTLYFFYKFHDQFYLQALSFTILSIFMVLSPFINPEMWPMIPLVYNQFFEVYWRYFIQALSIFALIPLAFYTNEKPVPYAYPYNKIERAFFYVFYPTHIALLAFLRSLL